MNQWLRKTAIAAVALAGVSMLGYQSIIMLQGLDGTIVDVQSLGGINRLMVDSTSTGSSVAAPMISRVDDSGTFTASGNSSGFDSAGMASLSVDFRVTAVSGTLPKLDIDIEVSEDNTNWFHLFSFPRITSTGNNRAQAIRIAGRYYRVKRTIAGTTPSFTYSMQTTLKAYMPRRHTVFIKYDDINFAQLNAVSTVFRAADVTNVSVMVVLGAGAAGTGRYRMQGSNDGTNFADITTDTNILVGGTTLTSLSGMSFRFYRLITTNIIVGGDTAPDLYWGGSS